MRILWLGLEHELGIENDYPVMIRNKDNYLYDEVIEFAPDLVIEREFNDGKHIWNKEIEALKIALPNVKTAVWFIDTHVQYDRHKEYMKLFDYAFFAISKYAYEFDKFWLPVCYPLAKLQKFTEKPIYQIGFVGRWGGYYIERTRILTLLDQIYGKDFYKVTDYKTPYQSMSKCRIMINSSFSNDMNYRVFEALGSGNLLVTNDVPDLHKIKGLEDRIFIYRSYQHILDIIDGINTMDFNIRGNIEYIEQYHMLPNRINSLLHMIKSGEQEQF